MKIAVKLTITLILIAIVYYGVVKPFVGERYFYLYKLAMKDKNIKVAEEKLLASIQWDNHSSYTFAAAQFYMYRDLLKAEEYINRTIDNFNGDLTLYAVWFWKGMILERMGNPWGAKRAYEKSLYYWPEFEPAKKAWERVDDYIDR